MGDNHPLASNEEWAGNEWRQTQNESKWWDNPLKSTHLRVYFLIDKLRTSFCYRAEQLKFFSIQTSYN